MPSLRSSHTSATFTALLTAFMWGYFPTPSNFLQHQVIVLQVNSILTLPTQKEQNILQVKRSRPQSTPQYTISDTVTSSDFTCFSDQQGWLVLTTSSLGLIDLLEWLTELSENLLKFSSLLKDMIKDTDEQPNKELRRPRLDPSTGAPVAMELGCSTLLVCGCVHHQKLPQTQAMGIFMEASLCKCNKLLTPFPAPLLSLEKWGLGQTEHFKLLMMI